jgi:hypothetical protein
MDPDGRESPRLAATPTLSRSRLLVHAALSGCQCLPLLRDSAFKLHPPSQPEAGGLLRLLHAHHDRARVGCRRALHVSARRIVYLRAFGASASDGPPVRVLAPSRGQMCSRMSGPKAGRSPPRRKGRTVRADSDAAFTLRSGYGTPDGNLLNRGSMGMIPDPPSHWQIGDGGGPGRPGGGMDPRSPAVRGWGWAQMDPRSPANRRSGMGMIPDCRRVPSRALHLLNG